MTHLPGAASAAPVPAGSGLLALLGKSLAVIALLGFDFDPSGCRIPALPVDLLRGGYAC